MRDMVSCFSEHALSVSDPSCSADLSTSANCVPSRNILLPSIQNAVNCVYKLTLSTTHKQLLLTVSWCRTQTGQGLCLNFGDNPSPNFKLNTNSRLFRKKKGTKSLDFDGSRVEIFWDLSSAKYDLGPEPVDGFYVLVSVDSELGLALGDLAGEAAGNKLRAGIPVAGVSLISRREHYSGRNFYSTRAQFSDSGSEHEILIKCRGEEEGLKHPVLSVWIDKKNVICVKRLKWNFRGNQTIFVDGLLVDLMWDVHDWFFNSGGGADGSGSGVFMFKTRKGMESSSRLWLEEKLKDHHQQEKVDFSLFIYACKSP